MLKRISQIYFPTMIILVFLSFPSVAASFDCVKAQTLLEKTVCRNPRLDELDKKMGEAYFKLRELLLPVPAEAHDLKEEQNDWLDERNSRCAPDQVNCLSLMYEDRIIILNFRMSPRFTNSTTVTLSGRYIISNYIVMRIQPLSEERIFIEINGAEPSKANWICSFSGTSILKNNVAIVIHESENTPITFTFAGKTVEVKGDNLNYFCGIGGDIGGKYVKIEGDK